ncbi:hypothetical protein Tco_1119888 [Tanacetum coccineum]
MADKEAKSTTRTIMTNDQADYYSGITSITVNGKNAYELKRKFLDDLHKNSFSRTHGEDAVEHIEYFLKFFDQIDLPNVNQHKLRVVVFPISLAGDAWRWYSEWSTCSWKEDGYFNRGNLPRAYIIGNTLHYQDLECNNGWRRWDGYEIADHDQEEREYENEHEDEERYEEYVAIKEDEYEGLNNTSKGAIQAYQEIFSIMDEGWMVTRAE